MKKGVIDQKNALKSVLDLQSLESSQLGFGLFQIQDFLTMTFRNSEVYPVYMKTYYMVFVFENICDYYYMIGLISEESLNFGLNVSETAIKVGDFWSKNLCILHA